MTMSHSWLNSELVERRCSSAGATVTSGLVRASPSAREFGPLTGATGMVGREVLRRAAADTHTARSFDLRGPAGDAAWSRLEAPVRDSGIDPARVVAIDGDVTEAGLGVDAGALDDVTDAIHCAATVSFDLPPRRSAPGSTWTAPHTCSRCRSPAALRRLDAVSTCYVAGRREGLIGIGPEHDAGFHNTYEQTRYEAELLLRDAMADLPDRRRPPPIDRGRRFARAARARGRSCTGR